MDFEFDEDQLGLQSSVAEVLAKECPAAYLRSVVDEGHDPADLWRTLCGLDWPGLAIAEADGGLGATAVELAIVIEQLGYVGDPTPFLATTTQFAPFVAACGSDEQRSRFLGAVAGGAAGTLALAGPAGTWDAASPAVTAEPAGAGWALRGTAAYVLDADRADELAVPATSPSGIDAFVVPADQVQVRRMTAFDGALHLDEVVFDGVEVGADRRLDGGPADAGAEQALDEATIGMSLATVGACQRILDLVLDYVRERHQFGVPIGSFQAVKHKAVDMYVAVQRARALGYFAALTVAEDDVRRPLAASMAKAAAGDAQRTVFTHGIQLFGGIGFTWENDLQMYLRRAKAGELLLGGSAHHRARVARGLLGTGRRPTEVLQGATDL